MKKITKNNKEPVEKKSIPAASPSRRADVQSHAGQDQKALLFELEHTAIDGRQIVFDVLRGVLKEKGAELTAPVFSRYCLYLPVKSFIGHLLDALDKKRLSEKKLEVDITEEIRIAVTDKSVRINSAFRELLARIAAEGINIGAITAFDVETADKLIARMELSCKTDRISYASEDKSMPSTDVWMRLAKQIAAPASRSVVLATSARSCKAALSAGMRCVAMPDRFSSFQDFAGADLVLDSMDGDSIDSVLALFKDR